MDKFRLMSTFVQVVQSGSFAAAAEELRVSKPLVSKHITTLERRLGVQLLNRTTRRINLTEIGQEYLERCKQILSATERAEQGILRLQAEPRGHMRITALHSIGVLFLASAIADFAARFPQIKTTLVLSEYLSYGKEIIDGGFDLAVHLGALPDSRIVARKICNVPRYVCASRAYIDKHGMPSVPMDLIEHNCLVHLSQTPDDIWHFKGPAHGSAIKVRGSITANSVLALRAAALRGSGVALLPAFCIEQDIARGDLVQVLREHPAVEGPLCVLYPHNRLVPKKVRIFIDFFVGWLTPPPWNNSLEGALPNTNARQPALKNPRSRALGRRSPGDSRKGTA